MAAKFIALAVLITLFSLNAAGLSVAYHTADFAQGVSERCSRACCDLGSMGVQLASSCCRLRCQDDVPERTSEPAREQIRPKKLITPGVVLKCFISVASTAETSRPTLQHFSLRPVENQVALHVKHSVFLV